MEKILLVVDMQNDFLLKEGKYPVNGDTSSFVNKISETVKNFTGKTYITVDAHLKEDCEFSAIPEHCLLGTNGVELVSELKNVIEEKNNSLDEFSTSNIFIFEKNSFSGAVAIDIATELFKKENEPKELYVVGVGGDLAIPEIISDIMSDCSTRFDQYPKVYLPKDHIINFDNKMAEMSLSRLEKIFGVELIETI